MRRKKPGHNRTHFLHLSEHPATVNLDILRVGCKQLASWEPEPSCPYWRLFFNDSPGMILRHNGREHRLVANACYLISPGTTIGTAVEATIRRHFYTHFILREEKHCFKEMVFRAKTPSRLRLLVGRLADSPSPGSSLGRADTYTLTSVVTELLGQLPEGAVEPLSRDPGVTRVVECIRRDFHRELSNDTLAAIACLTRNAFVRKFSKLMDISPQRYLEKVRLEHATILLKYSAQSISAIATACGFADRYYFSTRFKRAFQISPARYRRTFWQV